MFSKKLSFTFSLLPAIFLELPITRTPDSSNFFRFPLKVRVIGSQLYMLLWCDTQFYDTVVFKVGVLTGIKLL